MDLLAPGRTAAQLGVEGGVALGPVDGPVVRPVAGVRDDPLDAVDAAVLLGGPLAAVRPLLHGLQQRPVHERARRVDVPHYLLVQVVRAVAVQLVEGQPAAVAPQRVADGPPVPDHADAALRVDAVEKAEAEDEGCGDGVHVVIGGR